MKKTKFITALLIAVMSLTSVFAEVKPGITNEYGVCILNPTELEKVQTNAEKVMQIFEENGLKENSYVFTTEMLDAFDALAAEVNATLDLFYRGKDGLYVYNEGEIRAMIAKNGGKPVSLKRYTMDMAARDGHTIDILGYDPDHDVWITAMKVGFLPMGSGDRWHTKDYF